MNTMLPRYQFWEDDRLVVTMNLDTPPFPGERLVVMVGNDQDALRADPATPGIYEVLRPMTRAFAVGRYESLLRKVAVKKIAELRPGNLSLALVRWEREGRP